jgi:hypothetical protein
LTATHRQARQVSDLAADGAGDRYRQRADRGRLVDHHQHPTAPAELGEQGPQALFVVREWLA